MSKLRRRSGQRWGTMSAKHFPVLCADLANAEVELLANLRDGIDVVDTVLAIHTTPPAR